MSTADQTLREVLGAYVATQAGVIIDAEAGFRAGEPEIHSTRVAVRRLRSTLRTFGAAFDVPRSGRLEDELVWWAGLLGVVRDLDIMEKRLSEQLAALPAELVLGPVASRIATEIQLQRQSGLADVTESLDDDRFADLLAELHRWRSNPPFTAAADVPAAKVSRYVKQAEHKATTRLDRAIEAYGAGDPEAAELVHRARKATKHHRYAVEAAEPVLGSKAAKIVKQRKQLQELLGEYQDSVVIGPFLRSLGARVGTEDGHNGFTYGVLYGQELAAADQLLTHLKPPR